jgi:hypothetical protein
MGGGRTVLWDSFTDADGTLLVAHPSDSGVPWKVHPAAGTAVASIDTNRAHTSAGQSSFSILMARKRTNRYGRVSADVVVVTDDNVQGPGILAAHEPVQRTGFLLRYRLDTNVFEFSWAIDNAGVVLGTYSLVPVNGTSYRIEIDVRKGRAAAIIDGVERVVSAYAPMRHLVMAGLRVGIGSASPATSGGHLDNWKAGRS